MTPHLLRTIVRRLSDDDPDDILVRRFVASGDDAAFAALVRRHGATVWAACRHLLANPADAEDAFQATFVALARGAKSVRQPAAVGAWLHATAVRIALNLRRSTSRRRQREQAAARGEAAPSTVPDAAWHAALAAAHEEAAKLPEALRTAFVLCDLEGVSPADAAARLGWKPGTLTGRLTRARQTLLDRLAARGLAPLAVGVGVLCSPAAAPAKLVEAAANFANPAGVVPASLLTLAKGATEMARTKLLAAAVILSGGLLIPGGALLRAEADPPTKEDKASAEKLKQFLRVMTADDRRAAEEQAARAEAEAARQQAVMERDRAQRAEAEARAAQEEYKRFVTQLSGVQKAVGPPPPKWEFTYYAPIAPITLTTIKDTSTQYGFEGWEFAGTVKLGTVSEADRKKITFGDPKAANKTDPPTVLVFKRPTKAVAAQQMEDAEWKEKVVRVAQQNPDRTKQPLEAERRSLEAARRELAAQIERHDAAAKLVAEMVEHMHEYPQQSFDAAHADLLKRYPDAAKIVGDKDAVRKAVADAMAKRLADRFGSGTPAEKPKTQELVIGSRTMPNGVDKMRTAVTALVSVRFGDGVAVTFAASPAGDLTVSGDPVVIDWLTDVLRKMVAVKP